MKVKLLAHTPNPDAIAGAAARSCYSERGASEILEENQREKTDKSLKICIERGHVSTVEHASFTFSVEGVSRALSHQLVRHRIASYCQQSQRRVRLDAPSYVMPWTVARNEKTDEIYKNALATATDAYKKMLEAGIPTEDARYVLPNATQTNIVVTMNARSLLNFFGLRCCTHAQWELRKVANEMLRQIKQVAPLIFEKAGPPCVTNGICPEHDESCPMYVKGVK